MIKRKQFDDEWEAKKVFTKLDRKQTSSYSFKNKIGSYKSGSKTQLFTTNFFQKKQTEVVIKITGSSKNFGALKAHLKYITRNGEVEAKNVDFNSFLGKDDLQNLSNSFNENSKIPTQKELKDNALKEQREVLHFIFSMKDYEQTNTKKIREAAIKTINEIYPDNYFVIAMHNDTDNPHCHLALKVRDKFGKRINPKKSDLAYMRLTFAKELRALNVKAKATINKNNINFETGEFINDKVLYLKDDFSKKEHKYHYYRVVSYGEAHYKFNVNNKKSFYVRYRTTKGEDIDIWADDLKRVVKENNVHIGDFCRFVIADEYPVVVKFRDKKSGQWYQKTAYKKIWDVSIEHKLEKILKPLKNFTPNKYDKIDEPYDKIIDFGEAHYKFDENARMSYFIKLKDINDKTKTIWGKDLKDIIKKENLNINDECIFKIDNKDEKGKNIWSVKTRKYVKVFDNNKLETNKSNNNTIETTEIIDQSYEK